MPLRTPSGYTVSTEVPVILMTSTQILDEIRKLPAVERLRVAETILREVQTSIQPVENEQDIQARQQQMGVAAQILLQDYLNDPELTAFTSLDREEVHEAR